MGFLSARAGGRPGIYGPINVWASSAWGIRAEGQLGVPGLAGGWAFKVIGSTVHGCWAWAQGTHSLDFYFICHLDCYMLNVLSHS